MFCCDSLRLKSHRCCIIMLTLSAAETVTDSQEVFSNLFLFQSYFCCDFFLFFLFNNLCWDGWNFLLLYEPVCLVYAVAMRFEYVVK